MDRGPGFPTLSVVVPVYNEREAIGSLLERLTAALDGAALDWEAVLVDDGSNDGSAELLDRAATADPRLRVLHFQVNCGQSAALDAGFRHSRGALVALLDADLQTFPEDLLGLLEPVARGEVDAVVGIRTERRDTGWRRFSSVFANGVRNWLTREDIADTGCPLKVFRGDAIRAVRLFNGAHRFLPTLLRMEGYSVRQTPVRHAPRQVGSSKYGTWDRAFRALRDAFGVRWLQDRHLRWRLR